MKKNDFIEMIVKRKNVDKFVMDSSKNIIDFPIAYQILRKIDDSIHFKNLLNARSYQEAILAKGDLIRNNISSINDSHLKNESYKFLNELLANIESKFIRSKKSLIYQKSLKDTIKYQKNKSRKDLIEREDNYNLNEKYKLNNTKNYGIIQFEKKNFNEAIKIFDKNLEINIKDDELFFWRGRCEYELKNYLNAIYYFKSAININAKDEYYYWRHKCYKLNGNNNEAIEDLISAIKINPKKDTIYRYDLNTLKLEIEQKKRLGKFNKSIKKRKVIKNLKIEPTIIKYSDNDEEENIHENNEYLDQNIKDNKNIFFGKIWTNWIIPISAGFFISAIFPGLGLLALIIGVAYIIKYYI